MSRYGHWYEALQNILSVVSGELNENKKCNQFGPKWFGEELWILERTVCLITFLRFQANGLAAKGQYQAGSVQGQAGDQGLFIKDHNY